MKIIFLDIDGVLITRNSCKKGIGIVEPECVSFLNQVIEKTDASIVMSSCWRIGRNISEIQKMLDRWGVIGEVIGMTSVFTGFFSCRGHEIQAWLDLAHDVESFVIIDDDDDMGDLIHRLVRTNMVTGFTEEHASLAISLLEK